MRKEKRNMALKSVESQNVEFKSNWRDEYLKVISALQMLTAVFDFVR